MDIFLPLIMKNVLEKLPLYRRRRANTLLVSDWLKVFLENRDKESQKAAGSLFMGHLN